MSPSPDAGLDIQRLTRVASGDASALAELYDHHASMLFGLVCRIVRDRAEAEDVLQEVFLRVWERAGTYNQVLGSPSAWLARVARNRAIDRIRARAVRPELTDSDHLSSNATLDRDDNPELSAALSQQRSVVQSALASLTPQQRKLIEHAYYLGCTQSELAERFSLPLGTVKTRVRSAMLSLRAHLGDTLAGQSHPTPAHNRKDEQPA